MAISGQVIVAPEALELQAEQVRSTAVELKECFSRMKKLVDNTANYWKGEAADTHRSGYNKNNVQIEEIVARYNEHVRDLEMMAGVYREAETTAKNMADDLPAITL